MTVEEILNFEEMQIFDRKSIKIAPTSLSDTICAFANADGGTIAIGVTDKERKIEGVDFEISKLNELLRVPLDYCNPSIVVVTEMVDCIDYNGNKNHILLMHIEPSPFLHANQADEVYLRVGDKSKKMSFEDRITLMYDKGMRYFEDSPVADAELEDIDMDFVAEYVKKIKYTKSALEYLRENKGFVKEKNGKYQISSATILLFGKNPQLFFPRARIRFIRYDGVEEKFGTQMNVIKDVIFEGKILQQIKDAIAFLQTQIRERTYLGDNGVFKHDEEYPEFVRTEIIVNAATHRDYSIKGTDIQIKMFDNRIIVESPGKLPGLVKPENIRHTHFSRNPKIAEFLKNYEYVREYGEGVNRMCEEMISANLPEPVYKKRDFMLETIIYNSNPSATIGEKSATIGEKSATIGEKSATIGEKSATIDYKNALIEFVKEAQEKTSITKVMAENIIAVICDVDTSQVIGRKEIINILNCQGTKAWKVIETMLALGLLSVVKGIGKGKYMLNLDIIAD